MSLSDTSLMGYGRATFERDHFTCQYCGFDGRTFDTWMQLSVDHVRPRSSGGDDALGNLVTACHSCNAITSRMKFPADLPDAEVFRQKRERVAERRRKFHAAWLEHVAPRHLARPLPRSGDAER
jgi:hypothetical protein